MTVISKNLSLTQPPEPSVRDLSKPQIGWITWLRDFSTVTASSEQSGFEGDSVINDLTYNIWKPVSLPATLTFELEEARPVDFIGIAKNNLFDENCSLKLEYFDGTSFVEVVEFIPRGSSMQFFDEILAKTWRITVSGTGDPYIGVIYLGLALQMQRGIYQGFRPPTLNENTEVRPNISEGGQWLGRSIVRQGLENNIDVDNLTAEWVRGEFQRFVKNSQKYPFFFAWRNDTFPDEVIYCWTTDDIRQDNTGPRDLMSVSIPVQGIVD